MEHKKIITVAGKPGSGKSTISRMLAEELGYKHFSSGDLFRAIAKEKGVTVDEINMLAESDTSIDEEVDQKLRELREEDELIIDSRMAWHWIPESLKVYLDLDIQIAADRIFSTKSRERFEYEQEAQSAEAYAEQLERRLESESKRYMQLYNVNPYDTKHYDLVIDTYKNNPEQVTDCILTRFREIHE